MLQSDCIVVPAYTKSFSENINFCMTRYRHDYFEGLLCELYVPKSSPNSKLFTGSLVPVLSRMPQHLSVDGQANCKDEFGLVADRLLSKAREH